MLEKIKVHGTIAGAAAVELDLPELRMEKVGSDSDKGVLLSELAGVIVQSLLVNVSVNPEMLAAMPAALMKDLSGDLGKLVDMKALGGLVEIPGLEGLGEVIPGAGKALEGAGKEAESLLKGILGK